MSSADTTGVMGKLFNLFFLAAALVWVPLVRADVAVSGNLFSAGDTIVARTALGLFIAVSEKKGTLDLRTFDPSTASAAEILSFFLAGELGRGFTAFVDDGGEKRTVGGAVAIDLSPKSSVAFARDGGTPFLFMSGKDILVLLGSTVVLNSEWAALVDAIRGNAAEDTYALSPDGQLTFQGAKAGVRLGMSWSPRDCGEQVVVGRSLGDLESTPLESIEFARLIRLWKRIYYDPETSRAFMMDPAEGAAPCALTEIRR